MKNPMLEMLMARNPILSALKSGNPAQLLMNNSQMREIMEYVQSNGGDAKAAFYKKAEEMGINPDTILSQLR